MSLSPEAFTTRKARLDIAYRPQSFHGEIVKLNDILLSGSHPFSNDCIEIRTTATQCENSDRYVLSIYIKALKPVELEHFEAKYAADLTDTRMLANGFQSWSQAREMDAEDRIPAIRSSVAYLTQYNLQGDYDFFEHTGEKGQIHSNSYTHIRNQDEITFFGSLSEHLGYTYFKGNFNTNTFGIYKDVLGRRVDAGEELELIKIFVAQTRDAVGDVWDAYASYFPDRRSSLSNSQKSRHVNGWTSWYNYYGNVSEAIVLENLAALEKYKYDIDIFQIDDGFQTAIGDWLSINNKFPSGLKATVEKINQAGYTAGLWLAPYAVGFTSQLATDHPDWLVHDPATNKPVVAGPNWGGFYALDMYHPEARAYLKHVFDTVLRVWGFGMVKLDFLFAAAMIPRNGKSRGEIMWEAMEFVRSLTGQDKLLLGCGVPLACAWRSADYCRIGSDVAPWWEDTKLKYLHVRERVSTANSLISTLNRWSMSDRMFGNDPDVVILRDKHNKLKTEERYTLCALNNILGALVFISDNVAEYGADEHLLYQSTFPKVVANVESVVELQPEMYVIRFWREDAHQGKIRYTTFANLSNEDHKVFLPASSSDTHLLFKTDYEMHLSERFYSSWFKRKETLYYSPSSTLLMKPHETKTFMHIPPVEAGQQRVVFMGSKSHLVPGAEIARLVQDEKAKSIQLDFQSQNMRDHVVYLGIGECMCTEDATLALPDYTINGAPAKFEWFNVAGNGEGRKPSKVLVAVVSEQVLQTQ